MHRELRDLYDVQEAYQLLDRLGLLQGKNDLTEELSPVPAFSTTGRHALLQAVTKLCASDFLSLYTCSPYIFIIGRDGSKSFFASPSQVTSHFLASPSQVTSHFLASPSQVTSHFLASPSQVTSHLVRRQVKSSHKSFGPNTSQVTSLFVQVQVKSYIILSSCIRNQGQASNQSTVSYSQRYMKWSMVFNNFY